MSRSYRSVKLATSLGCAFALGLFASGCGDDEVGGLGPDDTGIDATGDVTTDSGIDSSVDTGMDDTFVPDTFVPDTFVPDTLGDTKTDTGTDTGVVDTGTDTGTDTGVADTGVADTGTDTGVDTGPPPVCYATSWCVVASGTFETLWDVWASGPSDVWTVGNKGTVLRYNGTAWAPVTTGIPTTEDVYAVWGSGPTNVFVMTNSATTGKVYRYNGTTWSNTLTLASSEYLSDLDGSGASDVWAVGPGIARKFDGTSWSTVTVTGATSSTTFNLDKAITASDNWILGSDGSIRHWNGATWSSLTSPTASSIYNPWAVTASDIYAPLFNGGAIHYNGTAWSNVTMPSTYGGTRLYGAWASSGTNVWLSGAAGILMNGSNAGGFSVISAPNAATKNDLNNIYGLSAANVWAVGLNGTILHYAP